MLTEKEINERTVKFDQNIALEIGKSADKLAEIWVKAATYNEQGAFKKSLFEKVYPLALKTILTGTKKTIHALFDHDEGED